MNTCVFVQAVTCGEQPFANGVWREWSLQETYAVWQHYSRCGIYCLQRTPRFPVVWAFVLNWLLQIITLTTSMSSKQSLQSINGDRNDGTGFRNSKRNSSMYKSMSTPFCVLYSYLQLNLTKVINMKKYMVLHQTFIKQFTSTVKHFLISSSQQLQ